MQKPPIVRRRDWGAAVPDAAWPSVRHPVHKVVIHHTGVPCDLADPASTVRAIERFHALDRGWGDIGYNLLIDPAGRVYEGRAGGLGTAGAHVLGVNAGTAGIALLGDFDAELPSARALAATAVMVAWVLAPAAVSPDGADVYVNPVSGVRRHFANVTGHCDLDPTTACPGDALHAELSALRRAATALMDSARGAPLRPEPSRHTITT